MNSLPTFSGKSLTRSFVLVLSFSLAFMLLWLMLTTQTITAEVEPVETGDLAYLESEKGVHVDERLLQDEWLSAADGQAPAFMPVVNTPLQAGASQAVTPTFVGTGQSIGNAVSNDVKLGDLNGDGTLDAFVANKGANKIWYNDGFGYFWDSGQTPGEGDSRGVALGDIDNDGDLDAVVVNHSNVMTDEVWINSSGKFKRNQFLSAKDNDGEAPIHIVCRWNNLLMVQWFVETNPQTIDERDNDGWTTLHWAANRGHTHVVEWLLQQCPELYHVKTHDGSTATELATDRETVNMMESYGRLVDATEESYFDDLVQWNEDEPFGSSSVYMMVRRRVDLVCQQWNKGQQHRLAADNDRQKCLKRQRCNTDDHTND